MAPKKTSTKNVIKKPIKKSDANGSPNAEFAAVFAQLKAITAKFVGVLQPLPGKPTSYILGGPASEKSHHRPLWFGGPVIGKGYVSFHLMPVYGFPALLDDVSPELRKRMQGKACFNFKKPEPKLFAELETLTRRGYKLFQKAGYIPADGAKG